MSDYVTKRFAMLRCLFLLLCITPGALLLYALIFTALQGTIVSVVLTHLFLPVALSIIALVAVAAFLRLEIAYNEETHTFHKLYRLPGRVVYDFSCSATDVHTHLVRSDMNSLKIIAILPDGTERRVLSHLESFFFRVTQFSGDPTTTEHAPHIGGTSGS